MRNIFSLIWISILISFQTFASSDRFQLADLIDKTSPGVVNISSSRFVKSYVLQGMPEFFGMFGIPQEQVQRQSSLGSGFLIDMNGYILTNNHVIEKADEIYVTLLDKRRLKAKIIGKDKLLDLALLQLIGGSSIKDLRPTKLGTSEKVRVGEPVFAIGNPFGLQHTVTSGIISAKNRGIGIGPFDNFLQTDCSINFGNSGGPLFNYDGDVIGINTAINAQGQGLGFAIPIDEAKQYLNDLKNYGYIVRPWLGILGETVTPAIQNYYNLPEDHGVVIARLAKSQKSGSGPAAKSGLQVGDILLEINDNKINERADVERSLLKFKSGDTVKVKYNRNGRVLTKEIKLSQAPDLSDSPEGIL